jgi:hypothetical protein
MAYYSEGLQSGILSANLLLAEYVNTSGGAQGPAPLAVMGGSVLAVIELQVRNAANSANVWAHRFWVNAAQPAQIIAPSGGYMLEDNERLRLFLVAGLVGSVQGSFFM